MDPSIAHCSLLSRKLFNRPTTPWATWGRPEEDGPVHGPMFRPTTAQGLYFVEPNPLISEAAAQEYGSGLMKRIKIYPPARIEPLEPHKLYPPPALPAVKPDVSFLI